MEVGAFGRGEGVEPLGAAEKLETSLPAWRAWIAIAIAIAIVGAGAIAGAGAGGC